jgi:Undecaprenyl-phosphate galactose phosphotransferase WbaP
MEFRITDATRGVEQEGFVISEPRRPNPRNSFTAKRALDIAVASLALLFVAPLLLIIALLVRLQDGKAAIFSHTRYGQNGRTFKCLKIRSMVPDAAERLQELLERDPDAKREWELTQKLTHDPRITPLGQFIRATSIDELPQLINVLKGDMSLVGPRPISLSERSKYGENFADYCSVRPGITGLWQVSGRSNVSYPERVRMDTAYALNRSFWGDIVIMLKTIPAVLKSDGAR